MDATTRALVLAECESVTKALGGDVEALRYIMALKEDGPWRAQSVGGYGSRYCKDIRVAPVSNSFSIVYWSGEGAAIIPVWSFHISPRRPHTLQNPQSFDEQLDAPVNLAAEHLRVLVYSGATDEPAVLREGMLVAPEGSIVWLEHNPVGGPQEVVPITFPMVLPRRNYGGVVLT